MEPLFFAAAGKYVCAQKRVRCGAEGSSAAGAGVAWGEAQGSAVPARPAAARPRHLHQKPRGLFSAVRD